MRLGGVIAAFLLAGAISAQTSEQPPQPTAAQYAKQAVGPTAVARAGLGAAVTQGTNTPSEWGQGAEGFGRRMGSAFAKHIVKKGIQFPIARLRHEALGYQRSDQPGFGPRLRHALLATVITHKTTTGKKTIAAGEISGAIGSGLISRLWQPASVRTLSAGFTSGGITLGADAGTNVLREFWPEIRHPHRRRQQESESVGPAGT
jgi:hypothetical protein